VKTLCQNRVVMEGCSGRESRVSDSENLVPCAGLSALE
jgi:hypothetical protein